MSFIKSSFLQFLLLASCNASSIFPRTPQHSGHSEAAPKDQSPFSKLDELLKNVELKDFLSVLKANVPVTRKAKIEVLKPKVRSDAKRLNILYGPLALAGQDVCCISLNKLKITLTVQRNRNLKALYVPWIQMVKRLSI